MLVLFDPGSLLVEIGQVVLARNAAIFCCTTIKPHCLLQVERHALTRLSQFAKRRQCVRIIFVRRQLKPFYRLLYVGFHGSAVEIKFAQCGLRNRITCLGVGFQGRQVTGGHVGGFTGRGRNVSLRVPFNKKKCRAKSRHGKNDGNEKESWFHEW